jgi:hypothetical protein
VVVVHEGGARGPFAAGDAGLGRGVGEAACALVAIELVGEDAGDVEVLVAVVVVVADRDSLAVARAGEARRLRHVLEAAVRLLAVEAVPVARPVLLRQGAGRHRVVDPRPVREEDVEAAVAVVVEERHPRAHGLRQVLLRRGRRDVAEVDGQRVRDVDEADGGRGRRRRGGGKREGEGEEEEGEEEEERNNKEERTNAGFHRPVASSDGVASATAGAFPKIPSGCARRASRGVTLGVTRPVACWITISRSTPGTS